jgi:hypothetical protein
MKCPRCGGDYHHNTAPGAISYVPGSCDQGKGCAWVMTVVDTPRDPLLVEREKTHGSFKANADLSQAIKKIMHDPFGETRHPYVLSTVHLEALDMIALKLSRILSGQANFKDHWDDIAGYAKLASEACDPPCS